MQAIEIEIAGAKDTLATTQDILVLRHEFMERLSEVRTELRTAIAGTVTHVQLYAALSAQTALLLGMAYFFVSHIPH